MSVENTVAYFFQPLVTNCSAFVCLMKATDPLTDGLFN